jgi:hypothetical protein
MQMTSKTTTTTASGDHGSTKAAVEALARGWTAVPIREGSKKPYGAAWPHTRWEDEAQVRDAFKRFADEGAPGIGLLLGERSGGLLDVDLDHTKALRLRDHFLPPTSMQTGRVGRPRSHRWYIASENLPPTRQYRLPDRSMLVELRSTGAQTVIPPSTWYPREWNGLAETTEKYRWEGAPWGGKMGPAKVDGRVLSVQVALLGLGALLLDQWPARGGRHDAYLALAGGLLRFGDGVHPYWEKNLPVLIEALADATHDDDGPTQRVAEVMGSTLEKLRTNGKATGFPKLAEIIGTDHAELARRIARDVEQLGGFKGVEVTRVAEGNLPTLAGQAHGSEESQALISTLPPEERNPMEERITSWSAVDLEPYLAGQVLMPEPNVLKRVDGKGLFYSGRVNMLFGLSEAAKTWISLGTAGQEMAEGGRALFIDFEDLPEGTITRLRALGVGDEDLVKQFRYVHPEEPLADMQRYRFGAAATDSGIKAAGTFRALLEAFDPTLIIADGMTVLYGLHGHDTNEATATEVITGWLKSLTRAGRTTVIVIDHTGKGGGAHSSPIGAHHKVAMVQGTALRVDVVERPMPGRRGVSRLIVYKDRVGAVRKFSTQDSEQVAGILILDSREEGVTRFSIEVPDEKETVIANSEGMERVLDQMSRAQEVGNRILALFGGDIDLQLKTPGVVESLGESRDMIYEAWDYLVGTGEVLALGVNRHRHYMLNPTFSPSGQVETTVEGVSSAVTVDLSDPDPNNKGGRA